MVPYWFRIGFVSLRWCWLNWLCRVSKWKLPEIHTYMGTIEKKLNWWGFDSRQKRTFAICLLYYLQCFHFNVIHTLFLLIEVDSRLISQKNKFIVVTVDCNIGRSCVWNKEQILLYNSLVICILRVMKVCEYKFNFWKCPNPYLNGLYVTNWSYKVFHT